MTDRDKLVNLYMAQRIRYFRHKAGISQKAMAGRMHLGRTAYRCRELGTRPVTLDFMLRFQIVLGLDIRDLWFPTWGQVPYAHDAVVRDLMHYSEHSVRVPTIQDVLELTAEAFQLPAGALTSGLGGKRLVHARTAAAFVVAAHPALKLTHLAREVRRTSDGLDNARKAARMRAGPNFWRKVEAIQKGLDEL